MNPEPWIVSAVLALVVSVMSMTITSAVIFERMRSKIGSWSQFLNELIRCPYCTSFWIALPLVLVYKPILISSGFFWLDITVSWFAIVAAATWMAKHIYGQI